MSRVLVTGANGFVGRYLCTLLAQQGYSVRAAVRRSETQTVFDTVVVGEMDSRTDWANALDDVDHLVHLAAHVHHPRDARLDIFREINTHGTLRLAKSAVEAGVKRFLFVSSIGVHGDRTTTAPWNEESPIAPTNPYATSKWEAEEGLRELPELEYVIVRPPLVYGAHAPGNFGQLVRLIRRGLPLPLASIRNRRSLIAVENLVDFLSVCLSQPDAARQTFVIRDGDSISTPELMRRVAEGLDIPVRLLPCPPTLLRFGLNLLGRQRMAQQLVASLEVDSRKARALLGWQPPLTMRRALAALRDEV